MRLGSRQRERDRFFDDQRRPMIVNGIKQRGVFIDEPAVERPFDSFPQLIGERPGLLRPLQLCDEPFVGAAERGVGFRAAEKRQQVVGNKRWGSHSRSGEAGKQVRHAT